MNGRELRLWHWRRAMSARAAERGYSGESRFARHCAKSAGRRADFHLGCVQVLNDHPDCVTAGTTAEQDDKASPRRLDARQKRMGL